jgi:hypothetical protein
MTLDLALSESAGSRSLDRLVRLFLASWLRCQTRFYGTVVTLNDLNPSLVK